MIPRTLPAIRGASSAISTPPLHLSLAIAAQALAAGRPSGDAGGDGLLPNLIADAPRARAEGPAADLYAVDGDSGAATSCAAAQSVSARRKSTGDAPPPASPDGTLVAPDGVEVFGVPSKLDPAGERYRPP